MTRRSVDQPILPGSAVGVPVGTLAIGKAGATNAALPAFSILSLTRPELRERLEKSHDDQSEHVRSQMLI